MTRHYDDDYEYADLLDFSLFPPDWFVVEPRYVKRNAFQVTIYYLGLIMIDHGHAMIMIWLYVCCNSERIFTSMHLCIYDDDLLI